MSEGGRRRWLHRIEDLVLAFALAVLVLLAAAQIVMRMAFDAGFLWLDPLLRSLVLWVALLGAMAAAREGRHISLDLAGKLLPARAVRVLRGIAFAFAAAVSAVLAWQAWRMVRDEHEFATTAFANVPVWVVQAILPIAFAVIAVRMARCAVLPPDPPDAPVVPVPVAGTPDPDRPGAPP